MQDSAAEFAATAQLTPAADSAWFGRLRGAPLAIRPFSAGLIVQARCRMAIKDDAQAALVARLSGRNSRLGGRISRKTASIHFDGPVVWLDLYTEAESVSSDELRAVIDDLLDELTTVELLVADDIGCHYCTSSQPAKVIYHDGRVAQICAQCYAERIAAAQHPQPERPSAAAATIVLGALGALGTAALWFGLWIALDALLSAFGHAGQPVRIYLPRLAELLIFLAVGALLASPIVLLVRRAPRRGGRAAPWAACAFIALGVLLGELALAGWIEWRALGTFSLGTTMVALLSAEAVAVAFLSRRKPRVAL